MAAKQPSAASKLLIERGRSVALLHAPEGMEDSIELDMTSPVVDESEDPDVIVLFAKRFAQVDAWGAPLIEAARADRIAWIAYPKGGQLGTDIGRDSLRDRMQALGINTVAQVSIDATWTALRFRPLPA